MTTDADIKGLRISTYVAGQAYFIPILLSLHGSTMVLKYHKIPLPLIPIGCVISFFFFFNRMNILTLGKALLFLRNFFLDNKTAWLNFALAARKLRVKFEDQQ